MAIEPERRAMLAVQTSGISYATLKDFDTLVARIAEQIREAEAAVGANVGAEAHCWFMEAPDGSNSAGPFDTKEQGLAWAEGSAIHAPHYATWKPIPLYRAPLIVGAENERLRAALARVRRIAIPAGGAVVRQTKDWRERVTEVLDAIDNAVGSATPVGANVGADEVCNSKTADT